MPLRNSSILPWLASRSQGYAFVQNEHKEITFVVP